MPAKPVVTKPPYVHVGFRLHERLVIEARVLAAHRQLSLQDLYSQAVEEFLQRNHVVVKVG